MFWEYREVVGFDFLAPGHGFSKNCSLLTAPPCIVACALRKCEISPWWVVQFRPANGLCFTENNLKLRTVLDSCLPPSLPTSAQCSENSLYGVLTVCGRPYCNMNKPTQLHNPSSSCSASGVLSHRFSQCPGKESQADPFRQHTRLTLCFP